MWQYWPFAKDLRMKEATEIEVEVLEVDGAAPVVSQPVPGASRVRDDWRGWQGRVRKFDSRWWPLWVILGIVAVGLLLTVGLVLAVVFVVFRLFVRLVRALLR